MGELELFNGDSGARNQATRAPRHIGGFGEGLVIYTLIRCGFEVATVDHVGADLIAEKKGKLYAISVKSRMYRRGSKESRGVLLSDGDLLKLDEFAKRFALTPLFAHVCNVVEDSMMHLVIFPTAIIGDVMDKVKLGYRKDIRHLVENSQMFYAKWREEQLTEQGLDCLP